MRRHTRATRARRPLHPRRRMAGFRLRHDRRHGHGADRVRRPRWGACDAEHRRLAARRRRHVPGRDGGEGRRSGGRGPAADGVTFTWTGGGSAVSVAGEFNAWDAAADPLVKQPDGSFRLTKKLTPGRYAYKFVVDGAAGSPTRRRRRRPTTASAARTRSWSSATARASADAPVVDGHGAGGRARRPRGAVTTADGTVFTWTGGGGAVSLAGEFNGWSTSGRSAGEAGRRLVGASPRSSRPDATPTSSWSTARVEGRSRRRRSRSTTASAARTRSPSWARAARAAPAAAAAARPRRGGRRGRRPDGQGQGAGRQRAEGVRFTFAGAAQHRAPGGRLQRLVDQRRPAHRGRPTAPGRSPRSSPSGTLRLQVRRRRHHVEDRRREPEPRTTVRRQELAVTVK